MVGAWKQARAVEGGSMNGRQPDKHGPYSWQTWSPADEWAPIADGESASATFARCYAEESAERGDGPATTARSLSSDLTGAVDP